MTPSAPPIKIVTCDSARREPGMIVFTTRPTSVNNQKANTGWVIGVRQDGEIALNLQVDAAPQDVRYDPSGTIFFSQAGAGRLFEIDQDGNQLRCWHAEGKWRNKAPSQDSIALPVAFLHHTFNLLPNGNFLVLSAEARTYDDYPTSTTDPDAPRAPALVVGDVIVEVTRDRALVREWHLLDMLDPYRISHGSLYGYWEKQGFPNSRDWAHANAIAYNPLDDSIVVSLRRQDCLVKFDCGSGAIRWILGNHSLWSERFRDFLLTPDGDLEWPYHQHDCSVIGTDRVICFDNGNYRASAFEAKLDDAKNYSRVVEYEIDESKKTVRQVWNYGGPGPDKMFACYQGGGLRLAKTGNTFMTFGGIATRDGIPTSENDGAFCRARLLEATPSGEIVFDLVIDDSGAPEPRPYSAFRADHVPAS